MKVRVGVLRHVVVDDDVDTLDVDATPEEVRGDHNARLEVLELPVALDSVPRVRRNHSLDKRTQKKNAHLFS
jgi:hypothetical protein